MYTTRTIGRAAAIAAAIALAAGSAVSATASPDPNDTKAEAPAPKPAASMSQRICVKDTITGSRMPRKFCKTREQWINENGVDPLADN